jgi:pimeloyl-ACP methyl ester carboxylesterase
MSAEEAEMRTGRAAHDGEAVRGMAGHRGRLLAGVPATERRIEAAGIPTTVLEGGGGPPVVLLHGPGESAVNWRWVLPDLARTHSVVAPDLPAHGSSGTGTGRLDEDGVIAWLGALVERTCPEPPVLVGHVLGGAIAARFAVRHGDRLRALVLVDSLGLAPFRPSARFAARFLGFQVRPNEHTYERFMGQCAFDLDDLRAGMGDDWTTFVAYNLGLARADGAKEAGRLFRRVGLPTIPARDLDRIDVPTTLIWGRQDRALRLRIAERASARHGWPLHVVDDAADDPPRDRPEAFLRSLRTVLDGD